MVVLMEKGRENLNERVLAINIGLALEDVIVADFVYRKAVKRGGYQKLTLMERDF
jgi:ornithine cyclodeaminase/alanine dehydrogenase-like protein (mu-crystallin family)